MPPVISSTVALLSTPLIVSASDSVVAFFEVAAGAGIDRAHRRFGRPGAEDDLGGGLVSEVRAGIEPRRRRHHAARCPGEGDGAGGERGELAAGGAVSVDQPDVAVSIEPFGFGGVGQ